MNLGAQRNQIIRVLSFWARPAKREQHAIDAALTAELDVIMGLDHICPIVMFKASTAMDFNSYGMEFSGDMLMQNVEETFIAGPTEGGGDFW